MIWKAAKKQKTDNTVGSYHAKTHMAQLLTEVEGGETFTITRNGRKVATLLPYKGN